MELDSDLKDQVSFVRTGKKVATRFGVWTVSHDGNVIVDGSTHDETFTIWSAETGEELYTSDPVESLGFDLRQGVLVDAQLGKLVIYAPKVG